MSNDQVVYENDFSAFGYREIDELITLLNAWKSSDIVINPLKVGFNTHSGCVFLFDDDYNTYMMNGNDLEQWYNCSYCGNEGFIDDIIKDKLSEDENKNELDWNKPHICNECGRDILTGDFPDDSDDEEEDN